MLNLYYRNIAKSILTASIFIRLIIDFLNKAYKMKINLLSAGGIRMSKKDVNIIHELNPTPKGEWLEFSTSEKAEWLPVGVKAFAMFFKANLGIIKGNVRIKGSEESHSFSTDIHDESNPMMVQNLWLSDRNQYQHFPIIEYMATEKSNENAALTVIINGLQLDT